MIEERHLSSSPIPKRTLLVYTALFLAMIAIIYSYFAVAGSSFIWEGDGLTQHYQLFKDYVDMLKGALRGEGFPLWNWSIGLGADTIASYGYYVIGDPFVYLGVLFPSNLSELAYHLLIFLRIWCIGGSFLLYARKMKFSHAAGLLGAVMYAFSHYVIYNVIRHPFFILPMIWYPLLCLGVEKLFRRESGVLFAGMVAVSAVVNFYFFYKLTLLTLLYGIVRYGTLYGFRKWKNALRMLWRCVYLYAVGVLLSAAVFLPMVGGFLRSSRSPEGAPINYFYYPLEYYYLLMVNSLSPGTYLWTVGGFSVFALFAVLFGWRHRKQLPHAFIPATLLILGVLVMFPLFGSVMNGLAGPYNRFTFAVPFYLALAGGMLLDRRELLEEKDIRLMGRWLAGFTVFYLIPMFITGRVLFYVIPLSIGWGMWSVLKQGVGSRASGAWKKRLPGILIALVALNMAGNAMAFYYPFGKNAMDDTLAYGKVDDMYRNLFGGLEEELPEDDLYRVGVTSRDNHVRNQFVYLDLMGLNSYLSLTNGKIAEFAYELESGAFQVIQPLRNGVDDRRIANHLLGVRYILTETANEEYLPFGYEVKERTQEDDGYSLAETSHAYPLAYAETTWMPRSEFSSLNPVEKEAYLAEGIVLEDADALSELERFDGALPVETIPAEIESDGSKIEKTGENSFDVLEDDAQFTLTFDNPEALAGKDIYIHLQGLDYERLDSNPLITQDTSYRARVFFGDQEKSILQSDRMSFSSYFYRRNMLFHMGYSETGEGQAVIQFDNAGKYQMEDVTVYALPADNRTDEETAEEKWAQALDISVFEDERIEGTISLAQPSVLTTSIPYSPGWEVQVNGEPVDTLQTNVGFIGVPLPEGESEVLFTYRTPLLRIGLIISLAGAGLLLVHHFTYKKKQADGE